MSYLFYNCYSLRYVDINNFDTYNVVDMSNMFFNCSSLENIDLNSFNTSSVNDMSCFIIV